MNVKQGYKQTEAGVIPEDWTAIPITEITTEVGDGIHSTPIYSSIGEYYFVNGNNISNGQIIITKDTKKVEYSEFKKHSKNLNNRSILLSINGTIGNIGLYAGEPIILGKSAAYLNINKDISRKYIYFSLSTKSVVQFFMDGLTGTTIKNLGLGTIRKTPIAIPNDKQEQSAIATALSDADALIQFSDKLLTKKRAIKQGTIQELLKPKETWVVKKLGEIFDFSGGFTASRDQLSNEGYCYLHYGDIHGSTKAYIDVLNEFVEIPKLQIDLKKVSRKSMLNDGDIVFVDASEDDEGTSRHIVINNPTGIPFISGLHTIVAKSKDNTINNLFKRYCFQSASIKSQFKFYAVGTKVSGISKASIEKIEIRFPSYEEQNRIATILSDMDAEITALETKLAKYKQIKQGMMQNLLTGRIRLV